MSMRTLTLTAFIAGLLFALWVPAGWQVHVGWFLFGLEFGLSAFSKTFLIFTAFVWLVCAFAATLSMPKAGAGFWWQMHLTYLGNMGLIISADAVGFYLFFSLMSLSAFGLIMHDKTAAAKEAAISYIKFAITGEVLVFAGVASVMHYNDTTLFENMDAPLPLPAVMILLAGFGIKAGLFLLHAWLPKAHAKAPGPVSALLSGVMLKTGVFGWIQFLSFGQHGYAFAGWALALLGLAGIYFGLYGLFVRGLKEMLAYSSISQMGYMALVSGSILIQPALFAGAKEALLFFMLHHGMAKAALFLLASDTLKNGRSRALVALAVIAAAFLVGLPFTSGAAAKTMLKDHIVVGSMLMGFSSVVTALLMARFLSLVMQRPKAGHKALQTLPASLLIAGLGVLSFWGYERCSFDMMQLGAPAAAAVLIAYLHLREIWLPKLPNADIANLAPSFSLRFLRQKPVQRTVHTQRAAAVFEKVITVLQRPDYALALLLYAAVVLSLMYLYLYF